MALRSLGLLAVLAAPLAAAETTRPSLESAKANANRIFNAVHSAGRQWGSSLNHNGFGFVPAVMPAGTLLYHGASQQQPPSGPEWLAFEVEHAENFATGRRPRNAGHSRGLSAQKPLSQRPEADAYQEVGEGNIRGYLHTYQTTRDVQLLCIDGMSAAKTTMGTLDSQDLLLRENSTNLHDGFMDERARAKDLCDMATEWGFDGVMRMEIGFEIIYCNFSQGLQLDSAVQTLFANHKLGKSEMHSFMWSRAVGERYDGLGDRVRMDFSSMVSAFFFPINISNTDPQRPDLVRLSAAKLDELNGIKAYLQDVVTQPRKFTVNWQAIVDMIVARLSKRLASMASSGLSNGYFIDELETATLTYYDAPPLPGDITMAARQERNRTAEAIDRCAAHYLKPTLLSREQWSPQDSLIHASVESVLQNVCQRLFLMRSILLEASAKPTANTYRIKMDESNEQLERAVDAARSMTRHLMNELAWTTWKKPQLCADDQILFVAMWPIGNDEDHWEPGCRSIEQLALDRSSYWGRERRRRSAHDADT